MPRVTSQPADAFLNAARTSNAAYRNLVTLATATLYAQQGQVQQQYVFSNQAESLSAFRSAVGYYRKSNCNLTPLEFQDLYSTAFSFADPSFSRELGFNAIITAIFPIVNSPQHFRTRHLPTVEWIRCIMPRPGDTLLRPRAYQADMLYKIHRLFDFLAEAQQLALLRRAQGTKPKIKGEGAIYEIITTPVEDPKSREPYAGFYSVCLHRILAILHLCLLRATTDDECSSVLQEFESLAVGCLQFPAPISISAFLWAQLCAIDDPQCQWAHGEHFFIIATKVSFTIPQ